jgi:hypothetical protein
MPRYFVVANQTLGGGPLAAKIKEAVAAEPCSFHVIVPATPPTDHLSWTEGEAHAVARRRLDEALTWIRSLGAEADGEVGDANPLLAVEDALREEACDEIIVSTLPPGASRWLKMDLPHRMETSFGLPVTHVVSGAMRGPISA